MDADETPTMGKLGQLGLVMDELLCLCELSIWSLEPGEGSPDDDRVDVDDGTSDKVLQLVLVWLGA